MTSSVARRVALSAPLTEADVAHVGSIAGARGFPTWTAPARLGVEVRELSNAYNTDGKSRPEHMGARLCFSLVRDVPKGASAIAELLVDGWHEGRTSVRILDLGAGLGATTWGVTRALGAAGFRGEVAATLVESDPPTFRLSRDVIAGVRVPGIDLLPTFVHAGVRSSGLESFDLVLLGQVLSELDQNKPEAERVASFVRLCKSLVGRLNEGGAVVVIEPALRDRTRILMQVRDELRDLAVRPCPHASLCPMLPSERDWCHEDLPVDLPPFLVETAREAGLRYEGLTFSYLILQKEPTHRREVHRLVRAPRESKGKVELQLCTPGGELVTLNRLTRDTSERNALVDELQRGDSLVCDPPIDAGTKRIGRETLVSSP